jgi:prevent-host-death family protein
MSTVTAKQLKQKTGEVIRRVRSGERLTVTYRGKPIAVIAPPEVEKTEALKELRSFDEAWRDIEQTLKKTKPGFKRWREAIDWMRNRT